jgi:uncharacterized protein YfaS (alpha-2-macroglobulin family)
VYAVAVNGTRNFGIGESSFEASLPLNLRVTLPRFLNYGDKQVEVTALMQNQTDKELEVSIAARGENIVFVHDSERYAELGVTKIKIPANTRGSAHFYVDSKLAGKSTFQFAAAILNSGKLTVVDMVTKTIPTHAPTTSEAFALTNQIDEVWLFPDLSQHFRNPNTALSQSKSHKMPSPIPEVSRSPPPLPYSNLW